MTTSDNDSFRHECPKIKSPEKVKSKFWSIIESGMSRMMSEAPRIWNGPDASDYERERKLISHCCRPIMYGMISSCLIFSSFRISANKSFQEWRHMYFGVRSHSYKLSKPETTKQWKSHSERQMEERRKRLKESMSIPSDFLLSVLLGFSVTGINIRPSYLKKKFEDSPLLPGKSLSATYLCNNMTDLFSQVDSTVWKNKENDKALDALANFTKNCLTRNEIEKRIRKENKLSKDQDIAIPESLFLEIRRRTKSLDSPE